MSIICLLTTNDMVIVNMYISFIHVAIISGVLSLCPDHWTNFKESCYYISGRNDLSTFSEAVNICTGLHANLVTVEAPDEQYFLQGLILKAGSPHDYWIGAQDYEQESVWKWVGTRQPIIYTNWCQREPNNAAAGEDCGAINVNLQRVGNYCWNDYGCNTHHNFICEKSQTTHFTTEKTTDVTTEGLVWRTIP